ncbi:unnamed protein product [Amoebophrya sp. A25]|nr:unnamed protein product [Amoebophrya sp. A25]|eukprot:GSA25T00007897001.1
MAEVAPPAQEAAAAAPAAEPATEQPGVEMDNEIAELEEEMEYMEKETNLVKDLSEKAEQEMGETDRLDSDSKSVYIGNVEYGATPEELQEHFKSCGQIARITIMVDKYTCCPKGFAYMEFSDPEHVKNAVLLNDSLFRGRQLKVLAKRTNVPGYSKGKGKAGKPKGKGKGKMKGGYVATYAPTWGKGKGKAKGPYYG